MYIRRELHWLPVYHRISYRYKLSLFTWKALHTAEPSYLSELISLYASTRTLRSVNTGLLVLPTGVTSHFASGSFSGFFLHQFGILCLHTSILLIIPLHFLAILNHTFSSQLSLPSYPAPAPLISCIYVCMYMYGWDSQCAYLWDMRTIVCVLFQITLSLVLRCLKPSRLLVSRSWQYFKTLNCKADTHTLSRVILMTVPDVASDLPLVFRDTCWSNIVN